MGELKVRFMPEGGFEKNGAFIEYEGDEPTGEETEYQRQGYLTLDIACTDFKIGTQFEIISEFKEVEERGYGRSISAKGVIQPARWSRYSLSFMGEKSTTHEIAINIRENDQAEAATMAGINFAGDIDLDRFHQFFLDLHLHKDRFTSLLKEISSPGAVLNISARVGCFRDFYAQWSPSVSEGRVIKFLDNRRDVENADEIPEGFWRTPEFQRELLSNSDSPPVTISLGRPLHPFVSPPASFEEKDDWNLDENKPPPNVQSIPPPAQNPVPALEELTKRVGRGAFWTGLWLALIVMALILSP